jgi:hypothetical protein
VDLMSESILNQSPCIWKEEEVKKLYEYGEQELTTAALGVGLEQDNYQYKVTPVVGEWYVVKPFYKEISMQEPYKCARVMGFDTKEYEGKEYDSVRVEWWRYDKPYTGFHKPYASDHPKTRRQRLAWTALAKIDEYDNIFVKSLEEKLDA